MEHRDMIEYGVGTLGTKDLTEELEAVFRENGGWSAIRERLPEGEDLHPLEGLPLTITERKDGLDPATATIAVAGIMALSPMVQKVVLDLWSEVWLPRIRGRKGENAVGDEKGS